MLDICLSRKQRFPGNFRPQSFSEKTPNVIQKSPMDGHINPVVTPPVATLLPATHGPDIQGLKPEDAIPLLLGFIEKNEAWTESLLEIFAVHEV